MAADDLDPTARPTLPLATSPTVKLVTPTDEERIDQWSIAAVSWRGPQTIEAFVNRELAGATRLGIKTGGIKHWILVDTAEQVPAGGTRTILASCETLRRRAIVSRAGPDGKRIVESTWCYGVAGVHSRKEFRGTGYGRRMITDIGKYMRHEEENFGMEKPLFSVLYSAVGVKLYSYAGFAAAPSGHLSIWNKTFDLESPKGLPPTKPLYPEDLAPLCKIDSEFLTKELDAKTDPSKVYVAMIPDVEVFQWHHAREENQAKDITGKESKIKGAIVGDKEGERGWVIWLREWWEEDGKLMGMIFILRLVIEGGDASPGADAKIAALLNATTQDAASWKLEESAIWNPSSEVIAAANKYFPKENVEFVQQRKDDDSLCCFAWYGSAYGGDYENVDVKDVEWVANEKWCWL